jgi:hypothetical protein
MALVNILSLPIENTQEIGNVRFTREKGLVNQFSSLPYDRLQLLPQDLKTLRLVCSQFNLAFESQVLSTLVISFTLNTMKRSVNLLEMFASRKAETSRAVQHARTLKIKYLSPLFSTEKICEYPSSLESLGLSTSKKRYLASAFSSPLK